MPMPWSAIVRSTVRPSVAVDTATIAPSSEYLIALSSRLPIADTSWRRSPTTVSRGLGSVTSTRIASQVGALTHAVDGLGDHEVHGDGLAHGDRSTSMRLSSRRSSIVRATRCASCTSRS